MNAVTELYDQIVDKNLLVRRITISANHIVDESSVTKKDSFEQLNLFVDYEEQQQKQAEEDAALEREKNMQKAMLSIKKKFGKNAILKGMNLEEGATAKDRNSQIGGHKACLEQVPEGKRPSIESWERQKEKYKNRSNKS